MKVLIITPTSEKQLQVGGGVSITYFELRKQLICAGHEVQVISSWNNTVGWFCSNYYPSFRLISCTYRNIKHIKGCIQWADVVVASDGFLVVLYSLYCSVINKPFFTGLHTDLLLVMVANIKIR